MRWREFGIKSSCWEQWKGNGEYNDVDDDDDGDEDFEDDDVDDEDEDDGDDDDEDEDEDDVNEDEDEDDDGAGPLRIVVWFAVGISFQALPGPLLDAHATRDRAPEPLGPRRP